MPALAEEMPSDAELVRTIAGPSRGEAPHSAAVRNAETELCRRFAARIRLYGLRHLRDEERARDLVQAVLVGLLVAARAGRVDDPEHVDRYVLGTCRHTVQRMRAIDARQTPTPDEKLDVASLLAGTEFVEPAALSRCVAALDLRGRMVITMSFFEDRSAEQIATSLATSAGNVRVLRHRAIAALRRCLDGPLRTDDAAGARPEGVTS
jgi:RNA polymerase sigma-70 factor (ECF subfamily)